MRGHLEPLSAVLRIGGAYGEPFTWSGMLRYLGPSEVEFVGIARKAELGERREIPKVLRAAGIQYAWFKRITHGVTRRCTVFDDRPKETVMAKTAEVLEPNDGEKGYTILEVTSIFGGNVWGGPIKVAIPNLNKFYTQEFLNGLMDYFKSMGVEAHQARKAAE